MDLNQLFRELSFGELSNLSLANEGNGSIRDQDQPRLIQFTNEALLRLYSRFTLKENDVLVELVEHITNYHLLKKFAETSAAWTDESFLYIKDLFREPFEEDVIRILSVTDSFGCRLPLNDPDNLNSAFTPQGNVLQVPNPTQGLALAVLYQAKHAPLVLSDPLDLAQEIIVPDVLHSALRAYIAYQVYNGSNTQEAKTIGQEHLARYEAICGEAIDRDLVSTSQSSTNTRFHRNGWQ